jgi:hypothetical protein|tara:strand:- start:67 stop:264 length:198 start_codon:yes stop_codon:yes gene_type:complete
MDTIKHNGKDIPVKYADVKVTIKHKETGVIYKDDEEWKGLGIDPSKIRRDVLVKMPRLDLFGETK